MLFFAVHCVEFELQLVAGAGTVAKMGFFVFLYKLTVILAQRCLFCYHQKNQSSVIFRNRPRLGAGVFGGFLVEVSGPLFLSSS